MESRRPVRLVAAREIMRAGLFWMVSVCVGLCSSRACLRKSPESQKHPNATNEERSCGFTS